MSLGIVINSPEGVVLASESRVTLTAHREQEPDIYVNFDNATKLLAFSQPNITVGAVTYGTAAIGWRTVHSFVAEFEAPLADKERLPVKQFAEELSKFFVAQWQSGVSGEYQGPDMTFVVAGFNTGEPYGCVFRFEIPRNPTLVEAHASGEFGITWGGQREYVDRLVQGYDHKLPDALTKSLNLKEEQVKSMNNVLKSVQMEIPLQAMPLQDCVNLAIFFIRTTINAQRLAVGIRACGGPIDVATITRNEGLRFVQSKEITGE